MNRVEFISHLSHYYAGSLQHFIDVVCSADFPEGLLSIDLPPDKNFSNFVQKCRELALSKRKKIFKALAEDKKNSTIFPFLARSNISKFYNALTTTRCPNGKEEYSKDQPDLRSRLKKTLKARASMKEKFLKTRSLQAIAKTLSKRGKPTDPCSKRAIPHWCSLSFKAIGLGKGVRDFDRYSLETLVFLQGLSSLKERITALVLSKGDMGSISALSASVKEFYCNVANYICGDDAANPDDINVDEMREKIIVGLKDRVANTSKHGLIEAVMNSVHYFEKKWKALILPQAGEQQETDSKRNVIASMLEAAHWIHGIRRIVFESLLCDTKLSYDVENLYLEAFDKRPVCRIRWDDPGRASASA